MGEGRGRQKKKNIRCGLENRVRGIGLFLLVGLFRKTDWPEYWRKYFQDFLYEANELINHKTWTEVDALVRHPEKASGIKVLTSSAVESEWCYYPSANSLCKYFLHQKRAALPHATLLSQKLPHPKTDVCNIGSLEWFLQRRITTKSYTSSRTPYAIREVFFAMHCGSALLSTQSAHISDSICVDPMGTFSRISTHKSLSLDTL